MLRTCIGLNLAVTVLLGLGVGLVGSTAAFNQFTADHLAHFTLLKAAGARPRSRASRYKGLACRSTRA
jgi:hypothetical protein